MSTIKLGKDQSDANASLTGDRQEPKVINRNQLQCPLCSLTFCSRQDYDRHWLACHQDPDTLLASGSMGSMLVDGEATCQEAATKKNR